MPGPSRLILIPKERMIHCLFDLTTWDLGANSRTTWPGCMTEQLLITSSKDGGMKGRSWTEWAPTRMMPVSQRYGEPFISGITSCAREMGRRLEPSIGKRGHLGIENRERAGKTLRPFA